MVTRLGSPEEGSTFARRDISHVLLWLRYAPSSIRRQRHRPRVNMRLSCSVVPALVLFSTLGSAQESAHADRALLLVDPSDAESLYVANEYIAARGIPASQVLYMRPGATNYSEFVAVNAPGFQGVLENRGLRDRIDFVVVAPTSEFYVSAPGLVTDSCSPVNRFAIGDAYGLSLVTDTILAGISSTRRNHYGAFSDDGIGFDSETTWYLGLDSGDVSAEQYFIGGLLGYTGPEGNSLQDILDLVQRSAAADGTHPAGTVYLMETTDPARSGPRDGSYPKEVLDIIADGGQAQHLFADLPLGNHDCVGIMTGRATLDIDGADFTLLPGSFADHLTSFAGRFDTTSQTKMSRWIAKGASGTAGTVEEPCNYSGKFPHAGTHQLIHGGLTLGEAWLRRLTYLPFQNQFYGDPLTAPYGYFPLVDVPDFPVAAVGGTITITPIASATQPGALIEAIELTVDGILRTTTVSGGSLSLDTTRLPDGWHEVRVLAFDDTNERNPGRFVALLEVNNLGYSVDMSVAATTGDLSQAYDLTLSTTGGVPTEVLVLHNGRVVASIPGGAGTARVFGQNLGAGPAQLVAQAIYADGSSARSAPLEVTTTFLPGTPVGAAPVAFDYSRSIYGDTAIVLELPASFEDDPSLATYTVSQGPSQATQLDGGGGAFVILLPNPGASGTDSISFHVTTPSGTSATAVISLTYEARPRVMIYGSGINPSGSIEFLGGSIVPGDHFQVALNNPLGTQAAGASSLLFFALSPDPNFPAGTSIPGFGMGGAGAMGELLISLLAPDPVAAEFGPPWLGPDAPSVFDVDIPDDLGLIGRPIYLQGLLLDPTVGGGSGTRFGLTEGLELFFGAF